jgi:hypothetical protein
VGVKFGDFLFPDSRDPSRDSVVIDETLREAWLADELGCDVIWLAEHHFDGICAYADPISLAGALATTTRQAQLGFAVLQMALQHPIRAAEQIAVLDNITKGTPRPRARPRLVLQYLRLHRVRHRSPGSPGAARRGASDHGTRVD